MGIGDGRQTYSDNTLMGLPKRELIEIIRTLERNCKGYQETIDNQATHLEKMLCEKGTHITDNGKE